MGQTPLRATNVGAIALAALGCACLPATTPPTRDTAFYIGTTTSLNPPGLLEYKPRETALPATESGGDRVWAGTRDGHVFALRNGRQLWNKELDGAVLGGVTYDETLETIYVGTGGGTLYALNAVTGEGRWSYVAHEEIMTAPTVAEGAVYVQSSAGTLFAVDQATGAFRWKHTREPTGTFSIRGEARPVAHGDLVYGAFADGHVEAFAAADGSVRWDKAVVPAGDYVDVDALVLKDGVLYAAAYSKDVVALNPATGEVNWRAALLGASRIAGDGPRLIAVGTGEIQGLRRRDGKVLWSYKLPGAAPPFATSPVVVEDTAVVSIDGGALLFLDAVTGQLRDAFDPGAGFSAPVAALGRALFVVSNGGVLYGLGLLP